MSANQYHLLAFIPGVEMWEMPPLLEQMARQLVASGQLRIHADQERNFVRHGTADSDATFTTRALTDPKLLAITRAQLAKHVPPAAGPDGVDQLIERLQRELKKTRGIDAEKELKVARVVVQSAHPSVIQLLLQQGTAIYVSYSHTVGDLLAVHSWQTHGDAGGLQSTLENETAVYISCGGDPFFAGEQKTYLTDGFPALARMMVIGGQELGHFADLKRSNGRILGRFSLDDSQSSLRAAAAVREGRLSDVVRIDQLRQRYVQCGLHRLRKAESAVAFYDKQRKFSPPWLMAQLWRSVQRALFFLRCRAAGIARHFATYPSYRHGEALMLYLDDMAFNLAPMADAYRHPDPKAEEAIACIEALARVPQQVHKWGWKNVMFGWPNLYGIYYAQVIPACIAEAGSLPTIKINVSQQVTIAVRRILRKRPQYYP